MNIIDDILGSNLPDHAKVAAVKAVRDRESYFNQAYVIKTYAILLSIMHTETIQPVDGFDPVTRFDPENPKNINILIPERLSAAIKTMAQPDMAISDDKEGGGKIVSITFKKPELTEG